MTWIEIVWIVVATLVIIGSCLIVTIVAFDLDERRRTRRILDRKYGQH